MIPEKTNEETNVVADISVRDIKRLLGVPVSMDSKVVYISPDVAKILLTKTNKRNRQLRSTRVDEYARAIRNDDWHLTQDAISFDENGVLTNGQHRLTAIAKCNRSVPVFVVFGISASTAIDTGAKRTFTDNIRIGDTCDKRIKDIKVLHQVFLTAYAYRNGNQSYVNITPDQQVELMNHYADELLECYNSGLFGVISTKGCNATVIKSAIFLAYLNGVSIDLLWHMTSILKTGVAETDYDKPIISLRDKLITRTGGGREVTYERLCLTQSCIHKLCKKSKTKTLDMNAFYTYDFK